MFSKWIQFIWLTYPLVNLFFFIYSTNTNYHYHHKTKKRKDFLCCCIAAIAFDFDDDITISHNLCLYIRDREESKAHRNTFSSLFSTCHVSKMFEDKDDYDGGGGNNDSFYYLNQTKNQSFEAANISFFL